MSPLVFRFMLIGIMFLLPLSILAQPAYKVPLTVPPQSAEASDWCGTVVTPEQMAFEQALQNSGALKAFKRPNVTYYVPISFHVVCRSDGTGGIPPDRLHAELKNLNMQFQQAGIQFFRLREGGGNYTITYLNSDYYYSNSGNSSVWDLLRRESPVPNTINVYYVPDLGGYCGMSSFPSSMTQGILMCNSCGSVPDNNATLAHEVGHYLNLYHTHETTYGVECPDGSNCSSAGDLLCSTPADPNLSGKVESGTCIYLGPTSPPPGCGGTYNPQTENQMSYSLPLCRSLFTTEQIDRMIQCLGVYRPELLQYDMTDTDGDGIFDLRDNCPGISNPDQEDADGDYFGDICDPCPNDIRNDIDNDGHCGNVDNCPMVSNSNQLDTDADGIGNACNCSDGVHQMAGGFHGDNLGWRVAVAGDINNDGFEDIIVGADTPYVYSGKDGSPLYKILGEVLNDGIGFSVGPAGDINKDGYDDILIGAKNYPGAGSGAGRVYIILGGAGPFPMTISASGAFRIYDGEAANDQLGSAIANIGDINNDGYDDHLIGASRMGASGPGKAYAYSGKTGEKLLTFNGEASGDWFGYAVSGIDDISGDNIPDIIIGAMGVNSFIGRVRVYSGADGSPLYTFSGTVTYSGFGATVANAGDVNNDGASDILIGDPFEGNGKIFIYSGGTGSYLSELAGPSYYSMFGWSVSGAGDINGDNYDDYAVGAPFDNYGNDIYGTAFIFSGKDNTLLFSARGDQVEDWYARDINCRGDYNNDGVNDLLVGAFDYDLESVPWTGTGRAYVYYLGDKDADGILAGCDNCPTTYNPDQMDSNLDGKGDACTYICGDANDNGSVNVLDLTFLVNFLYKQGPAPNHTQAADVNRTGTVNILDITYLINFLYKHGPALNCL